MENLSTTSGKVNGAAQTKPTVQDVVKWVEAQASKADMGASGARLRITSLLQMAEQVAPDEPKDAQWLLDNVERLRERWARRNPEAKVDTAVTYASRAKTTVAAYLVWAAAPDKYDAKKVLGKRGEPGATKKRSAPKVEASVPEPQQQQPFVAPSPRGRERAYEMADGREFVFTIPTGGMTISEMRKLAYHLLTLASDFDPEKGNTGFGLARRDE